MRLSDLRFLLAWLLPLLAMATVLLSPATTALSTLVVWWGIAPLDALLPGRQRSPRRSALRPTRLTFARCCGFMCRCSCC